MDEQTRQMGERLRQTRKGRGLTMQEVADGAGLSVGFISQIERGLTGASLASLVSISKVLDTPVSVFLETPGSHGEVSRHEMRRPVALPDSGVSFEQISSSFDGHVLRSFLLHEAPGHRDELFSHEGEELIYVLQGAVTVELDGKQQILEAGDSIHFESRRTHGTWNHTDQFASLIWCGTMNVSSQKDRRTADPIHKDGLS